MSKYNKTDLDPKTVFERHVFHRDIFAHYLRWSFVLDRVKRDNSSILTDFGCGKGYLAEVLYRNRHSLKLYQGLDIRKRTIEKAKERLENVDWIKFYAADLILDDLNYLEPADIVTSFEVIEHIGRQNASIFLKKFKACGKKDAVYYLSTPNYDEKVGAAGNHTYNGRINEFKHEELQELIKEAGFNIVEKFGTFASQKDYKDLLSDSERIMFTELNKYYDSNLISVIFAPLFPEQSRNCLWVLKKRLKD